MIVRFFTQLQQVTLVPETTLQLHDLELKEVLEDLCEQFGESFKKVLFDDKGELYVKILVNGRNIDYLDGLESIVAADDTVAIFPPVAGG